VASGLYWSYWLNSQDAAERQKAMDIVKKQLETASILGCQSILVIPGTVNAEFAAPGRVIDYETTYNTSLESLMQVKQYAEEYKVEIALENVWNKFLLSPLEMRSFIDAVGSPWVGAYFDTGNVVFAGYPEQWIKILGKRIFKVHFKDYRRNPGGLNAFVDLLAGDVDWKAVRAAFEAVGYEGWAAGEMIPQYAQGSDQLIYNTSASMERIMRGEL
jgi:hexulose-6-phosphate isomerase